MDRETLKKMVERMVRASLASGEAGAQSGGSANRGAGAGGSKTRYNYGSEPLRGNLIVANWKMNMTSERARDFAAKLAAYGGDLTEDKTVVICPPIYLAPLLGNALAPTGVALGAQNMHYEESGAYTSEISPLMLRDAGCDYAIIGHSERRHIFGEDDDLINKKVVSALDHGLRPILCVGETEFERERNATFRVVRKQLRLGLNGTTPRRSRTLIVGYEPVWAIGTGRNATPEDAQRVHSFIREMLAEILDHATAKEIKILYGGSVKPSNAPTLIRKKDVDGFLVGGASLSADKLRKIVEVC